MMEWKNIYRGMIMGATDLVPGISGGTIAVLLGIYDRLIGAINGIFTKNWKRHVLFLIPLGVGMLVSIFMLANVIEWLLLHYPGPTKFFFIGLILGVLPFLFHKAEVKTTFKAKHYLLLGLAIAIVTSLNIFNPQEGDIITNLTFSTYVLLFFSGFIASSAMIAPGISGSFMLLLTGVYSTVIAAISNLHFDVILVTGAGIVIGFFVMSRIVGYFLSYYYTATYAVIIGLVIGSSFVIFPGFASEEFLIILSVVAFAAGLLTAYLLGKIEYKGT